MTSSLRPQAGATLVELVITIVIIGIAVAGVVGAFSTMAGRSADPLWQSKSVALAQIYADEIIGRKFDEAAGNGGTPPYTGGGCDVGHARAPRVAVLMMMWVTIMV